MVAPDDTATDPFDEALALPGIEAWSFELAASGLTNSEIAARLYVSHRRTALA